MIHNILPGMIGQYTPVPVTYSTLNTGIYSVYNGEGNTNDYLGNFNAIASSGLTYSAGKINNGFSLNGSGYIDLPTNTHNFQESFSFSFFMNLSTLSSTVYPLANYSTSGVQRGWYISVNIQGSISFYGYNGGTLVAQCNSANSVITTNTWYHVTVIYNIVSNSAVLYVDNTQVASDSTIGALNYNTTSWPTIGCNKYTSSLRQGYVTGIIDAVSFWDRALTTSERNENYNSAIGKQYPFSNLPSCALTVSATNQYGFGTSNNYNVPMNGLYNYSVGMYIIKRSDIASAKKFTGLQWDLGGYSTPFSYGAIDIYLAHTSLSDWSVVQPQADLSNVSYTNLTKVVNAQPLAFSNNTWQGFTFNNTFCYDGTSNLLVVVYNNDGSGSSGYGYAESVSTSIFTSAYFYSSVPLTNQLCTRQYFYPNTKLIY